MLDLFRSLRRPRLDHEAVFLEFALSLLCLLGARGGTAPRPPRYAARLGARRPNNLRVVR